MKKPILYLTILLSLSCCGTKQQHSIGEYGESEVKLDSIPLTAYQYKIKGNERYDAGDKTGAIQDYTRAIMVNPQYDTAYYNRGNTKSNLGDEKGAIEDYNKAIKINPQYFNAHYNRGLARYAIGDVEGEISDYRIAIKINPKDEDVYNNLGRALYDLKRFEESAEAYGGGIKHFPQNYELYYGRGLARNQSGDKKGACEDWRKSGELGCLQANMLLPLCEDCDD